MDPHVFYNNIADTQLGPADELDRSSPNEAVCFYLPHMLGLSLAEESLDSHVIVILR